MSKVKLNKFKSNEMKSERGTKALSGSAEGQRGRRGRSLRGSVALRGFGFCRDSVRVRALVFSAKERV